ncbi:MAG: hypothetical protein QXN23_02505 [Candidatus Caldarchaeum sp.]|uniref:Uncharacterized protein n=1 Tax=Caldiarchaeum subterraneum TaxID=311458 RepID=A0A7J3WBX9_CALS0
MRERLWASRRVAVPGIALATLAGVFGVLLGAFWLLSLSGSRMFTQLVIHHPKLVLYGFVYTFIASVAAILVPRFREFSPQRYVRMRQVSVSLLAGGIVLSVLVYPFNFLGFLLASLGASALTVYIVKIVGRPRGYLAPADPLIILSMISMSVTVAVHGWLELSGFNPFSREGMVQLGLYGAPASMVFGIGIKTVRFRIDTLLRRGLSWMLTPTQLLTIFSALAAAVTGNHLYETLSSVFFLASSALWIFSVNAFHRITSGVLFDRMAERDRARYLYFSMLYTIASAWLLAAAALGLLTQLIRETHPMTGYLLRDSFIHSFTVGFIANMILAYSPIILPSLITGRIPYKGLSYLPAILLNMGNIARVGWFLSGAFPSILLTTAITVLYIASIFLTLAMMHNLR